MPAPVHPVSETAFVRRLLIAFSTIPRVRVWRQNVGTILMEGKDGETRVFTGGPPKGASDISGIVMETGWRLECEAKLPKKRRTKEQLQWAAFIERIGGVYLFCEYDPTRDLEGNAALATERMQAAIAARHARDQGAAASGGGAARSQRNAMAADLAAVLELPSDTPWVELVRHAALLRASSPLLADALGQVVARAGAVDIQAHP